jgi:hypothetical protein
VFLLYHHYIQKGKMPGEIDALSFEEKELLMASMVVEKKREKQMIERGVRIFG